MPQNVCEMCEHFIYDYDMDGYVCEVDLDMDEVERMMNFSHYECPYFRFGDEYNTVRKQN